MGQTWLVWGMGRGGVCVCVCDLGRTRSGDRHFGDRHFGDRKFGDREFGDRKFGERNCGDECASRSGSHHKAQLVVEHIGAPIEHDEPRELPARLGGGGG